MIPRTMARLRGIKPGSVAVTAAIALVLALVLPDLVRWAVLRATWSGTSRAACAPDGACWAFVRARLDMFLYGFYPADGRWRVQLAGAWLLLVLLLAAGPAIPGRGRLLALLGLPLLPGSAVLLAGGVLGLPPVETRDWGGLSLTLFMTVAAGSAALPLGVLLALGRQSTLPTLRGLCAAAVEFWRGVPIIAVIFLASMLLPLMLPAGATVDRLLRAVVGLALVVGAYMAEVIRGALQTLPAGQVEAAMALGLGYWRRTLLIVLPQALRTAIPGLVNESIALLKNTTLVLIVSLFDLLGAIQAALADPNWVGLTAEAYSFAALAYWLMCFVMSRYGARLESRLRIVR